MEVFPFLSIDNSYMFPFFHELIFNGCKRLFLRGKEYLKSLLFILIANA